MIYDVNKLDLMGKKKDGSVELYIISTGTLDDSEDTQKKLMDKIENYLGYIHSKEFSYEFKNVSSDNIWIILKVQEKLPQLLVELNKKIVPWVNECGANYMVEISNRGQ